jgi:alkylated DNA repair protein alkB family protein 1
MSGKGRQSYHGGSRSYFPIPLTLFAPGRNILRLLTRLPAHFLPAETDDAPMSATKRFMSTARINLNARQVFPPGFRRPDRDA